MVDVTIYTRNGCGYCTAAKGLLSDKGVAFVEHNATIEPTAVRTCWHAPMAARLFRKYSLAKPMSAAAMICMRWKIRAVSTHC